MRSCCALLAGILAGGAARTAHGDEPQAPATPPAAPAPGDVRDTFGLRKPPPAPTADCSDGRAPGCALATDPLDEVAPFALSTWLAASYLTRLPVADATHDAVASYALGAGRDDVGPSFGGATGLENRWTLDGAPIDGLRTGAADTRIPLAFLDGLDVRAGGFAARDRASTGGTIDARLVRGTRHHELATSAWTSIGRAPSERPIARGDYTLRRATLFSGPDLTVSAVATGPIGAIGAQLGGAAWYAAGVAPTLATTRATWRASRLVDDDADGNPDGFPGDIATAPINETQARTFDFFVPAMARLGLDLGPHRVELTLLGHAQRDARFLGNATLQAAGVTRTTSTGDAIATWRGRWPGTRARLQAAWHRSVRNESARDRRAAGLPQLLTAYIPTTIPDDPTIAAICDDTLPTDPAPLIPTCAVPTGFFASGGAGELVDTTGDRASAAADIAHRIGDHVLRAGVAAEDTRLITTTAYTATELQISLFPGELSHTRFYRGSCFDDPGQPCDYASGSELTYRTVYLAAYAEDTYVPRPGLAINGGLRWESMQVGARLHFPAQLAPRLGVVWDPLGGGRSRLWASAGRTFALLPAGLGATVSRRDATVEDFEIGLNTARLHDGGAPFPIAPGVEPITQDELALGGEVALAGAVRAVVWAQGRWLRHGLETTPDGFDNPGGGGEAEATRGTQIVAAALEMARRDRIAIRAGALWGRTTGTWAGPYDPRQGANLLQGPAWDAGSSNLDGPLPTDPGRRGFVEAEVRGALGGTAVAIATRLTVGSGRPRDVYANGLDGIVELLPRGAGGRNPVIAQANLRLLARFRGVTATLDVQNVFDRRAVTNLDEVYTDDVVTPIEGGSAEDLVFLKNVVGASATRRTAYQLPTAFQPPLAISLGVHAAF